MGSVGQRVYGLGYKIRQVVRQDRLDAHTSLGSKCLCKPDLELGLEGRDHEPRLWLVGTPGMVLRDVFWKLGGMFKGIIGNLLGDMLIWVEMGAVVLHCSV